MKERLCDSTNALERILARFRDNEININQASLEIRTISDSARSDTADRARSLADDVQGFFYDRKGFDDWWDSLDEDIATEIMDDLVAFLKTQP